MKTKKSVNTKAKKSKKKQAIKDALDCLIGSSLVKQEEISLVIATLIKIQNIDKLSEVDRMWLNKALIIALGYSDEFDENQINYILENI